MAVLSLGSLPLGYRFRPTDAELVDHYLRLKINGDDKNSRVIREIDVCKHEPWDLPDLSALPTKYPEWFFFCPRDIKYPSGSRLNRATHAGYWKATGKDRQIKLNGKLIGMKKTLVFYIGRAPKGERTRWVMHEYRTTLEELDGTHPGQSAFVLCRLFNKQDETIDDSNLDDSPTAVKSSPADVESELEMPQDSPSPALLAGPSVDQETKHRVIDLPANEVNLQQGNDSTFNYPLMYPLSLPRPLQIREEMCPSGHDQFNCSRLSVARGTDDNGDDITAFLDSILTDGNDGNSIKGAVCEQSHPMGFSLAEDDNGDDITAFLDSILTDGNDGNSIKGAVSEQSHSMGFSLADEGSLAMFGNQAVDFGCSETKLDENVLKSCRLVEHDMKDRNFSSIVGDISEAAASCQPDSENPIETGIRIRPRPKVEVTSPNVAAQGDALRRLRVQRKLQIGPTVCRVYPRVPEQSDEDQKSKTLDTEETKVIEEEQPEVVPSEEAEAKDDVPRSVNREGWSTSQRKGLLPLCSFIILFMFFTILVLSLSLLGTLFRSSSSQY